MSAPARSTPHPLWSSRVAAVLFVIAGAGFAWGGGELLALGGSPYYLAFGLACLAAGILAWWGSRHAAMVYLAALGVTVIWAVWEAGAHGWTLLPRLDVPLLLALLLLVPRLRPKSWRGMAMGGVITLVGSIAALFLRDPSHDPQRIISTRADIVLPGPASDDWQAYGRTDAGQRYSPLSQITTANVAHLQLAWSFRLGYPDALAARLEATPLMIGDTVYVCNVANDVFALDAQTGRLRWKFTSGIDPNKVARAICRGVAYFAAPASAPDCPTRIITTTSNGRLIALDARTGRKCRSFGNQGEVDLTAHMGPDTLHNINISSAPLVLNGKIIVGGGVREAVAGHEAPGAIRAYDALTGRFAWVFDPGRPNDSEEPPSGTDYVHATPNAWAGMSGDPELGLVYVPFASAPQDFYAGKRTAIADFYSDMIAALDVDTGRPRWTFRTIRHDLWDYDVSSAPSLIDLPVPGGVRHALVQATKQGDYYVLDRVTGEPIKPVVLMPAPQGTIPGGFTAPAQPRSIAMPRLPSEDLAEKDMWGITPFDQLWCRIRFKGARYNGRFTPPGLHPILIYPSNGGGVDWGGVSLDPVHQLIVTNTNNIAHYVQLITRKEAARENRGLARWWRKRLQLEIKPQLGAPYAALYGFFMSPLGIPCNQPPLGEISAIDIATGGLIWRQPLGTARDSGPFGLRSGLPFQMGLPNVGGTLTTAGGLTFVAASQERAFRAFGTLSGRELWRARLPVAGNTTPMTYQVRGGNQYVVLAAGGDPALQIKTGDFLLAYALPRR